MNMKTNYLRTVLTTLLVAGCIATQAQGQAIDLIDNYDVANGRTQLPSAAASYAVEQPAAADQPMADIAAIGPGCCGDPSCTGCSICCGPNCGNNCASGCGTGCGDGRLPWCSEECPDFGFVASSGYESWRGISDAANEGNFGAVSSLNLAIPIVRDFGIAGQFGLSQGVYDWMGRTSNGNNEANRAQQQLMFTFGFFRRACGTRFQGGFVQDWMINDNFGTLSQEPTLSQFRAQIGFVVNERNEIGVNLTHRDRGATQDFFNPVIPVTYSSISYTNLFWHRKWCEGGTDSWIWWGVPAYRRLDQNQGGSIGEFLLGGALNVPVTARVAAYANVNYMKPSARAGIVGSSEEFFNLGVGLSFVPGGTRTRNVTGQRWMPLMPVANNGNFLVDRSL
jgi:hypothetical protein